MQPKEKIEALRRLLMERGLDAWIVPGTDPHQSEYLAEHWQARAWLSGFQGSAGTLAVTAGRAGLWTDPRYHIRAAAELAGSGIELFRLGLPGTPQLVDWLREELAPGAVVGFDGWVMPISDAKQLRQVLTEKGITAASQADLLGLIWPDRPALPLHPVFLLPDFFSGETRRSKIERIRQRMRLEGVQHHLISALDEIAWTLNLRGSDIECNPVAICYAVVGLQEVHLFLEPEKVSGSVEEALAADGVFLHAYAQIEDFIRRLPETGAILIDPEKTNLRLRQCIPAQCTVKEGQGLASILKTAKNPVELEGIRRMHRRDGAALVRWLGWLEREGAAGQTTEIGAAEKLGQLRSQGEYYQGPSFATICGYAANSAVGHYRSDPLSAPVLQRSGILLVDSGGQYLDGTSDITRTLSLGEPSPAEQQAFTIVLKCHIRLAEARFPTGTRGCQLDAVAREPLWQMGWNCRHGIGHGVGCFLNVHEGPIRFNESNQTVLEAGMVISNEPGVYFEGRFGIRIENLLMVVPDEHTAFGDFLRFETVSLCPIDLNLVEPGLLNVAEIAWLNGYHRRVFEGLAPLLDEAERAWLARATRQI